MIAGEERTRRLLLYHGTDENAAKDILYNGINLAKGKSRPDFGRGFYTTPNKDTATKWAIRKSLDAVPVLLIFEFDESILLNGGIQYKKFDKPNILWAQFIVNNRSQTVYSEHAEMRDNNIDAKYPIVIGQIADGQVSKISRELSRRKEDANDSVVSRLTDAIYPLQYSFHTEAAIKLLSKPRIETVQ